MTERRRPALGDPSWAGYRRYQTEAPYGKRYAWVPVHALAAGRLPLDEWDLCSQRGPDGQPWYLVLEPDPGWVPYRERQRRRRLAVLLAEQASGGEGR